MKVAKGGLPIQTIKRFQVEGTEIDIKGVNFLNAIDDLYLYMKACGFIL